VQEAPAPGSWGESVISRVALEAFELLDAQPALVAADQTPIPYARSLEEATLPGIARITAAIRKVAAA
jgi:pyruvate/2-oxoglutarate/acetoin dehydrogenase E1 component